MVELSPAVAVVVVLAGVVGAVPALAVPSADGGAVTADAGTGAANAQNAPGANESAANESLSPGEQFAGVVGVQQAEFEGEVSSRAFGLRVAAAASNESKAGVLQVELGDIDERLTELEARERSLEAARENGTLGEGAYRAKVAKLHAEKRAVQRLANRTERVASGLPAAALEARGVDTSAIGTLKDRARNLTGPDVAAVARSIAGKGVGIGVGGPADRAGPPGFVENRTTGPGDGGPPDESGPANANDPQNETGSANGSGPPDENDDGDGSGSADESKRLDPDLATATLVTDTP